MSNLKYFQKFRRRAYYFFRRNLLIIPNFVHKHKEHQYLFILSPPFCGSTLLNQIISTSNNVSCNNNIGTREGQTLPEVIEVMFNNNRWNENAKLPWQKIKKIWRKYWELSKPILLDKSIPNIMRANKLKEVFSPISFICIVRSPYAQCEGIIRRTGKSAEIAAKFTIDCLRYQKENIESQKKLLFFTYEELCDNKDKVISDIINFIPELEDININKKFKAHNFKTTKSMQITNLNKEKIKNLSKGDLEVINKCFDQEKELLKYFNYPIINSS